VEHISKKKIPEHQKNVILEITCEDVNEEDVEGELVPDLFDIQKTLLTVLQCRMLCSSSISRVVSQLRTVF
jgi:hypothetical protein